MKRVCLTTLLLLLMLSVRAQSLKGRITNESKQPLEYVNVMLCQIADSAFVQGAVTDTEGCFSISTTQRAEQGYLLHLSSIGYKDLWLATAATGDLGELSMTTDSQLLDEVSVTAMRPQHKLTTGGVATDVENTLLSKAGTANDVLARIPGIIKKEDGYEVFGKGAPIIYINGRQMRDPSELDNLSSENIKSVEVISAPGARYDASVNAVIRIKTRAIKGEGFGYDVRSSVYQSENTDIVEQLNYNYRHNSLDLFGTMRYARYVNHTKSQLDQEVRVDTLWQQANRYESRDTEGSFQNIAGVNYATGSHSLGARYTLTLSQHSRSNTEGTSAISANGQPYDFLSTIKRDKNVSKPNHLLNMYYNGKVGQTEIDFNGDYVFNGSWEHQYNAETSRDHESRLVTSTNEIRNRMWAGKLNAQTPVLGGMLSYGTEYINLKRDDDYVNPEQYVPTSFSTLKEERIAPFVEYSHSLPFGTITAGMRYEHVQFDYYDDGVHMDDQSKSFNNLFPNLSLQAQAGKVGLAFNYSATTVRPTYLQLRNGVMYGNRFTLQTGNPKLKYEIDHNVSLTAMWKFVQFNVNYTHSNDYIMYWTEQLESNPAITLIKYKNIDLLRVFTATMVLSPSFGRWTPSLMGGVRKQWVNLETSEGTYRLNKPMFFAQLNNAIDLGRGWTASTDLQVQTHGNAENVKILNNLFYWNASIRKSWMNDRLSLQLAANDILHEQFNAVLMTSDRYTIREYDRSDSRTIGLTLRYKFNTTRSKYKGTGAGEAEKGRM